MTTGTPEASWKVVGHEGCETEQIDRPGAIKARGWLLAVDVTRRCITHLSSNLHAPIGAALRTSVVLGRPIDETARALDLPDDVTRFEAIDGWRSHIPWLTTDPVVITAHTTGDHYIIEIEPDIAPTAADPTSMIAMLLQASSWQAFSEQTVNALGEKFGYARTMAYTFHPDHHGEVTAEYLNQPDLEPYLGLHYPAADIPPQARRLYVRQLVRIIEDVDGASVHLLGSAPDGGPAPALDLTFAHGRAVSPVHLEYMRNMGVAATASVSVVQRERLTGMFLMHHTQPRALSLGDRQALATISRIASFVATTMDENAFGARRAQVTTLAEELRRNLTAGDDAIRCIQAVGPEMMRALEADGFAARLGREVFRLGDVPRQDAIDGLVRASGSAGTDLVQASDCLAADLPALATPDACAGGIVARLPGTPEGYLSWFRRPFLDTVRWGGEVNATVRKDEFGRLHPRGSFSEFVEDVTDRSRTWSEHDRMAAETLYQAMHSGLNEWAYRQLANQATLDPLTGLGNRRALSLAVDSEIRPLPASRRFALLFLDLDRFKQINDAHGHHKGDQVLQATADRLERVTFYQLGRSGRVFRLGGDEFVVLLLNATPDRVSRLAERILAAFRDPVIVDGVTNVVSVSIGAVTDSDAEGVVDADELLRRGDLAMYSAKRAGGSRITFYHDDFSKRAVRRSMLEQQLYQALDNDELFPVFQPMVSLRTGQIVGAEALARWRQPGSEVLLPAEFIPLAEETGQIRQVDRRITEHAVTECRELLRDPSRDFQLSVNVSALTVDAANVAFLADLIEHHAFRPERLTIELTESAVVRETGGFQKVLSDIRSLGVKVAVDDFGTGYSSLAHLQNLPVDMVKLDRTFVQGTRIGRGTDVVARWAIRLVSELGLRMIAEAVETREQEEMLLSFGYDWVQGNRYGAAKPGPPLTGPFTVQ